MDDLPIGPMLAVVALLILWSGLFTAIEAAHQHVLAKRVASRSSDKPLTRLSFPLNSLILCNTLCRTLVVVICTLLALCLGENGPWVAASARAPSCWCSPTTCPAPSPAIRMRFWAWATTCCASR
jgi:hypothetical protein